MQHTTVKAAEKTKNNFNSDFVSDIICNNLIFMRLHQLIFIFCNIATAL